MESRHISLSTGINSSRPLVCWSAQTSVMPTLIHMKRYELKIEHLHIGSRSLYTQYLIKDHRGSVFCLTQLKATFSIEDMMISCKGYLSAPLPRRDATAIYWYGSNICLSVRFSPSCLRATISHYPVWKCDLCTAAAWRTTTCASEQTSHSELRADKLIVSALRGVRKNLRPYFTRWSCSHCWWEEELQRASLRQTTHDSFLSPIGWECIQWHEFPWY